MKRFIDSCISMLLLTGVASHSFGQEAQVVSMPITTRSQEALSNFKQGLALTDLGEGEKARPFFQKAVALDSTCVMAQLYLGITDFSPKAFTGRLRQAGRHLETAGEWEQLYYQILESFTIVDTSKRFAAAKKMVARFPHMARSYMELGFAYDDAQNFAAARENYLKAIALAPEWVGGYQALASSLLEHEPKDVVLAEQHAQKVVQLAPDHPGPYVLLGNCYKAANQLDKARATYSKALEIDPSYEEAYYKRGSVLLLQEKYDEARQDYSKGKQLDENPSNAIQNIAITYLFQNKRDSASQLLLNEVPRLNVKDDASKTTDARFGLLASAFTIAFHNNDAATMQKILQQMKPVADQYFSEWGTKEVALFKESAWLYWDAELKVVQQDYAKALANAEKMRQVLQPINHPFKFHTYNELLGHIHYRQRHFDKAVEHFEKSDTLFLYNNYWRAKALEGAGQKDKALRLYKAMATSNVTDLEYALVVNELRKKLGGR